MDQFLDFVASILVALIGISVGLLAYLQKRRDSKRWNNDIHTQMLIGLGHDRIVYLGVCYIERGWLTQAEYENIVDYLYKPYSQMGGNGTAEKIINEIRALPIRPYNLDEIKRGARPIC
jgi:hypothetical protein